MLASSDSSSRLRVGILGCANIAKKNAVAILDPSSNCCITAVASRSLEKAQSFVNEMLLPSTNRESIACYGNYDELIKSINVVDALYIPLPSALHKEWVLKALRAGKHVLLEKPVALSSQDYQEMIQTAKQNKLYLMDGTMFVHHPRTTEFAQSINDSATFGTLTRIEAGFSFCGDEAFFNKNIRASSTADPLGCLGDLGWYVLRMALLVMGPAATNNNVVSAQVVDYKLTDGGVPIDATCLVKFENATSNNVLLNFQCSFTSQFRQYIHVIGTKAWASMDDFVLPKAHPVNYQVQSMSLTNYDLITQHNCQKEQFDGPVQEVLMWRNFERFASAVSVGGWEGDSDDCKQAMALSEVSANNQKLLDALMESIRGSGTKVEVTL